MSFLPKASTQQGYLISPPLQFNHLTLYDQNDHLLDNQTVKGKWLLIYAGPATCPALCQKNVYQLKQIHIASGKDQSRILGIRLYFKTRKQRPLNVPGLLPLMVDKASFATFIHGQPAEEKALAIGAIYLVDPLGNMLLQYNVEANPSGLFKDLKHLLGVSQIG